MAQHYQIKFLDKTMVVNITEEKWNYFLKKMSKTSLKEGQLSLFK